MPEIFKKNLQHRLLAAFLLIGLIPYLLTMLYFSYWGRASIIKHEHTHYTQQANETKQLIQGRIERFEREVVFLSQLEIFDDMIAKDVDHRISRLLNQMSKLAEGTPLILHAIDSDGEIIASSQAEMLQKKYTFTKITKGVKHLIKQRSLVIILPLSASFDNRPLGYLVAQYSIDSLKRLMLNKGESSYAIASKDQLIYGDSLSLKDHSVALEGTLQGYKLFYSIDEGKVLIFINYFMLYLSLLLLLGIVLIYYTGRFLTRQITQPVMALTQAAEKIITTQDYSLRVQSDSIDEIGSHAFMFNRLVETAGQALEKLTVENQFRMQRFIDLTDMFNHITQIDDEHDCIDASIAKLHTVVSFSMHFIPAGSAILSETHASVELYMHDIGSQEHILYGYLIIEKERFDDDLEERFFRSVGAMMMLQIERISLINKIQDASQAKSTFISGMSHELRTPLNAIIGFSQYLIAYEEMSDEQVDTVSKIEKAALHLLHMINDILDIAKIEAGKMKVTMSDASIAALLRECTDIVTPLADEKGLILNVDIDTVDTLVLRTDEKLFKQIIINLLSNAIKFTDSGSILLSASLQEVQVIIRITDTGVGIEKEDLLTVFEAFTQLKDTRGVSHKGTGLGLSLSRHIAESIGARLSLQSKGKGLGTVAELVFESNL